MAYRNPDDPHGFANDELRRQTSIDNELQADPELAEGPASGSRVAMFAVGIALVLGAVFYGLNNTSIHQAGTSTAQNAPQVSPPAAPPGMRDVTPRANTEPGVTTGAATGRDATIPPTRRPPLRRPAPRQPINNGGDAFEQHVQQTSPCPLHAFVDSVREHLVQFAARRAVAQFGKRSLVRDLARRAHEAGPRGARQRPADADAANAEAR